MSAIHREPGSVPPARSCLHCCLRSGRSRRTSSERKTAEGSRSGGMFRVPSQAQAPQAAAPGYPSLCVAPVQGPLIRRALLGQPAQPTRRPDGPARAAQEFQTRQAPPPLSAGCHELRPTLRLRDGTWEDTAHVPDSAVELTRFSPQAKESKGAKDAGEPEASQRVPHAILALVVVKSGLPRVSTGRTSSRSQLLAVCAACPGLLCAVITMPFVRRCRLVGSPHRSFMQHRRMVGGGHGRGPPRPPCLAPAQGLRAAPGSISGNLSAPTSLPRRL
jgi:hypothetical protein